MSTIPAKFEEECSLIDLVDAHENAHSDIFIRIKGLPQVGLLAYECLVSHLGKFGHEPVKNAPGLWKHTDNGIRFVLVADDFGVTCYTIESLERFINALNHKHKITASMEVNLCIGVTLDLNCKKAEVN